MKYCPFCGHDDIKLMEESAGADGVPCYYYECGTCGVKTVPIVTFVEATSPDDAKKKAAKRWDLRARVARNEDLVDVVDQIRSLLETAGRGCLAKTKAAQCARDAIKGIKERVEQILPLAKKATVIPRGEGRFTSYQEDIKNEEG